MKDRDKTTMSVSEMRQILGLKKTDSYWLVHRQLFETVLVAGKMRVVLESFEHWYTNQVKYKKVAGPPPGAELKAYSYSIPEIATLLGVCDSTVYEIIKRDKLETFEVASWRRVRKVDFNAWYRAQTKYRTADDRARDAVLEEESMTMPEMARLLLITRKEVYRILYGKNANRFEFITIANRRRVTKKSFERWYAGQSKYRKLCDRTPEEVEKMEREKQEAEHPELKIDVNKAAFTLQEAAVLLDITYQEVRALIGEGTLEAKKYGVKYLIPREDIKWFIFRRTMDCEK